MNDLSVYLPGSDDAALVIRTDFSDDSAWRAVQQAVVTGGGLYGAWGPSLDADPDWVVFIADRVWAGGTEQDVRAALTDAPYQSFFVADATAMQIEGHPLMTFASARDLNDTDGLNLEPFRCYPEGVFDVYANLTTANMSFWELAHIALSNPTQTYTVAPM